MVCRMLPGAGPLHRHSPATELSLALGFISEAVENRQMPPATCMAQPGKSHFMAVLDLLLAGNTQAARSPNWRQRSPAMTTG